MLRAWEAHEETNPLQTLLAVPKRWLSWGGLYQPAHGYYIELDILSEIANINGFCCSRCLTRYNLQLSFIFRSEKEKSQMEARNRALPEWFNRIRSGQVRLPRFQREEAWGHDRVCRLLGTVLKGLPAGATLILEVGDKEKFKSRPMQGAPVPTERVTEHLLDGQQRLTALWRSFSDGYDDRTYFVGFEQDELTEDKLVPSVHSQPRWERDGMQYPLWTTSPKATLEKGFIPFRLLQPGDITKDINQWCKDAIGENKDALKDKITKLREQVTGFNLPFLSLPADTPKDTAISVFIEMNRSAVQLTAFDIIVAQVEEETGLSLHDLVLQLKTKIQQLEFYANASDVVLAVAALREDLPPTQASFQQLNISKLVAEWDKIVAGLAFAIEFLEEEKIFDAARLPTIQVVYALAALSEYLPPALDSRGNAKTLLRKYLWRAFCTRRYENSAASRTHQDVRGLKSVLLKSGTESVVPIFNETDFPLPTMDELRRAGWPKKRDILARAILGISIRTGALDLADGSPATRSHLTQREYHHLFPVALLADSAMDYADASHALNCALITWNTNRNISAKEPLLYLEERVLRSNLGEDEIRMRLNSHVIPFEKLKVGGYAKVSEELRAERIGSDYSNFVQARAELMHAAILQLCEGRNWNATAQAAATL